MRPLRDEHEEPELLARETVFEGAVWDVRRDTFRFHGEELTREVVEHPGAVAVLALDADDRVLLIRQYRHPVATHEWELPAGLLDVEGEDPLVAAQRELAEEADLVAEHWAVLVDYYSSPGGMDEALRIYLARGLSPVPAEQRHEREGEEAHLEERLATLEEVRSAILAGDLHNPSLIVGVLAACAMRDRDWQDLRPAATPWTDHPAHRRR